MSKTNKRESFDFQVFQSGVNDVLRQFPTLPISKPGASILNGSDKLLFGKQITPLPDSPRINTLLDSVEFFKISPVEVEPQVSIPVEAVKAALAEKRLKKYLCPVLKSISGDLFDYSKIMTPIIVSLSLVGTIAVPLTVPVVAGIVFAIAKAGVAVYCGESADEE